MKSTTTTYGVGLLHWWLCNPPPPSEKSTLLLALLLVVGNSSSRADTTTGNRHVADGLRLCREPTIGKAFVADQHSADRPLPKATVGKAFVEGKALFAERVEPSAKDLDPVVHMASSQGPCKYVIVYFLGRR
jgi:hypothetical protein